MTVTRGSSCFVDFASQTSRDFNLFALEKHKDRFKLNYDSRDSKLGSGSNAFQKSDYSTVDFGRRTFREQLKPEGSVTNLVDEAPRERQDPTSIERKVLSNSVIAFDKQSFRDDSMYRSIELKRNIEMENTREDRQKDIEERKLNRRKHNKAFVEEQRELRKKKRSTTAVSDYYLSVMVPLNTDPLWLIKTQSTAI